MRVKAAFAALVISSALFCASLTHAAASPATAALQVALQARGVYHGPIDGVRGAETEAALRAFQRAKAVPVTGRVDRATRAALGKLGRPRPGARQLHPGTTGWDVSWLEFRLATLGFAPGRIDGRFDRATNAAVAQFRRFARVDAHHCQLNGATFRA